MLFFDEYIKVEKRYTSKRALRAFHKVIKDNISQLQKDLYYVDNNDLDKVKLFWMNHKFSNLKRESFYHTSTFEPYQSDMSLIDLEQDSSDKFKKLLFLSYMIYLSYDEITWIKKDINNMSKDMQKILYLSSKATNSDKNYKIINIPLSRSWENRVIKRNRTLYTNFKNSMSTIDLGKFTYNMRHTQTILNNRYDMLARTELNYTANQNIKKFGLVNGLFFARRVSILDNRTSQICESMAGMIVDLRTAQEGVEIPPNHPNCRTILELEVR